MSSVVKTTSIIQEVQIQTLEGLQAFLRGLPLCLLIPTYLFLMNPNTENGILSGGSIIALFVGLSFVPPEKTVRDLKPILPNAFLGNTISLYGITVGFMGGYKMLEGVFNDKLGNILASFLVTLIVGVLVSWGLHVNDMNKVPAEIANTFLAISIGGVIGGYCAWVINYVNKKKDKKAEKSKVLCKAYDNGKIIDITTKEE
jgi:hypothetical protein